MGKEEESGTDKEGRALRMGWKARRIMALRRRRRET
jgi:hypothetical protein